MFFKPTITAKLIKGDKEVRVNIRRAKKSQAVIILFAIVKQVATMIGVPHRQLMNQLITLDKTIVRAEKKNAKIKS